MPDNSLVIWKDRKRAALQVARLFGYFTVVGVVCFLICYVSFLQSFALSLSGAGLLSLALLFAWQQLFGHKARSGREGRRGTASASAARTARVREPQLWWGSWSWWPSSSSSSSSSSRAATASGSNSSSGRRKPEPPPPAQQPHQRGGRGGGARHRTSAGASTQQEGRRGPPPPPPASTEEVSVTEPAPASNSPPGPATPAPGETATSRPCHVHASRNSSSCDDDDGSECDSLEGSGCSSMGPSKDKQGGKEGGKDKEGRDKGSAKGGQPAPFGLERAREVVRQWKAQPNQRKALLHDAEQYNSQQTAGPPASLSRLLVAHLQYLGAGSGPKATGRSTAEELQKVMSSLRGWDNTALGCPRSLMSYCLYVSAGLKGGGSVPELHALVQATVNDRERKFADEETWIDPEEEHLDPEGTEDWQKDKPVGEGGKKRRVLTRCVPGSTHACCEEVRVAACSPPATACMRAVKR